MRISDEHRELLSRVRPVGVPETPCTECVPDVNGNEVTHSADCAVSLDTEAVCDRDRAWFDRHPAAEFFYREVSWGEAAQLVVTNSEMLAALPPESLRPYGVLRQR